jgi:hypothetical protein
MGESHTSPGVAWFWSARFGFSLPGPFGLHPICRYGELRRSEHLRHSEPEVQRALPPIPSALRQRRCLLWPLLTSRSALCSASPFQVQGEISPGKNAGLLHTTAGFTPQPFDHGSFAIRCSLAPGCTASYPVSVRRPMDYVPRFLQTVGRPSALALHFPRCGLLGGGLAPPGRRP